MLGCISPGFAPLLCLQANPHPTDPTHVVVNISEEAVQNLRLSQSNLPDNRLVEVRDPADDVLFRVVERVLGPQALKKLHSNMPSASSAGTRAGWQGQQLLQPRQLAAVGAAGKASKQQAVQVQQQARQQQ